MKTVTISMPVGLLERLDRHAESAGKTRDAVLRELTERGLDDREQAHGERIEQLLDAITGSYGGHSVVWIREDRKRDDL